MALHNSQRSTDVVGPIAAVAGGLLFLVGTIMHPARDGHGIAEVGHLYGITHAIQGIGLLLMAVALANLLLAGTELTPRLVVVSNLALIGTISWFGLIVYDGSHNPVSAQHTPDLVHTTSALEPGGAMVVFPAIILFPIGYALLAPALVRGGARLTGWLLGGGAVIYTIGGTLIFPLGPSSSLIQPLEVIGATALSLGYVLLGRRRQRRRSLSRRPI